MKGRDWYDFLWYISKKIIPNLVLFENAIEQKGPWENQHLKITPQWYISQLKDKIEKIDWNQAKKDVERFLNEQDRQQLTLWSKELFLDRLKKLESYIESS